MALDGITLRSVVDELNDKIVDARVDKVYQPEEDELVLVLRGKKGTNRLLISASASHPRIYLAAEYEKTNPKKAPMFCMLLRKHLQGGIVKGVRQHNLDRVLMLEIESMNELKQKVIKILAVEIMSRHSNIILINKDDNKIVDSIKKISHNISSVREVLPGLEYSYPPSQNKINPLKLPNRQDFAYYLRKFNGPISKGIYSEYEGISPLISKEICYRAGVNAKTENFDLTQEELDRVHEEFFKVMSAVKESSYEPCIALDTKRDKAIAFSAIALTQFKDADLIRDESPSAILEAYFNQLDIKDRIQQRTANLRKNLSLKLDRLKNKSLKLNKELEQSEERDIFKLKGELLTSYIYMVSKGMESVNVSNYYSPNGEEIEIKLNPNKTPSENAQSYFKKYNKLKHAKEALSEQLRLTDDEISYLDSTLLYLDACDSVDELKELKNELMRQGYIKSRRMPAKKELSENNMPMEFTSSSGLTILVGKNNKQNDYLTLRLSDNEDIWLHTKNIPGSHVLIKCAGRNLDDRTLEEAATLAAYYSKAKNSSKVEVDYTEKRNVKKPSGSKPGMVIYETNKTIIIDPDEVLVNTLKKRNDSKEADIIE